MIPNIYFQFDYIIWTGDLISHDDWDQTREEQLHLVDYFADMFMTYFPDTPVYWSLGNHESVPVNRYLCIIYYGLILHEGHCVSEAIKELL